uniref:Pentatricopeptide repeat-containing protein n=1 Tax=Oryza barthii TaxID=65489 RepID=A0A0D3FNR2_9ORYZ
MAAEGLGVFRAMFMDGVAPDAVVLTTAITACAQAGALECGEWVHRYVERSAPGLLGDAFVGSALVSMYAKCGCLEQAVRVFDGMPERNDYVWGTMVGAFAVHGRAEEDVSCLDRMAREDGVRPDGVAVLGALSACAHAGKVDDGLRLLREMSRRYGVAPGHEHYACTVDMLCRVGRLEDALSNIYLDANRKDDARRVRKLIGSRGIRKVPAYSEVEVDSVVSSFVADDQAHPQRVEIWEVLRLLADQMGGELDEGETMAELS